jgi:uncharacterized repeat protein (TIGR02543 family)
VVADISAAAGTSVGQPTNPDQPGYVFQGWYSSAEGGILYTWPYTLNGDVTMHAQWQAEGQQYTVTFDTGGGNTIDPVTVDAGSTVNKPDDPAKTGYVFDNWHTAATGGTVVNWPLTVNEDTTVYARWIFVGQGSISILFSDMPLDDTTDLEGDPAGTLSWTTGILEINVPEANFPGAAWQWYLDNAPLSGETSSGLNMPGSDFTLGRHTITVRIKTTDNRVYSKTLRFTVAQ